MRSPESFRKLNGAEELAGLRESHIEIFNALIDTTLKYGLVPDPPSPKSSVKFEPFRTIGETSEKLVQLNIQLNPPDPHRAARQFGIIFPSLDNITFGF